MEEDFPFERGEFLIKLNRIENLRKLKLVHLSLTQQIERLEEEMTRWRTPKNPREDNVQIHGRKVLQVWKRQKIHHEEQILSLETQVRKDIEDSKNE